MKRNSNHIWAIAANLAACALLLFPDYHARAEQGIAGNVDLLMIVTFALLFVFASTFTKTFRVCAVLFLLMNIVYLHIFKAWGPYLLSDRIEVMLESPLYESIEYLREYVGVRELKILAYAIVCLGAIFFTRPLPLSRGVKGTALAVTTCFSVVACDLGKSDLYQHAYAALPLAYQDATARRKRIETRLAHVERLRDEKRECTEGYEHVLVVIGESASSRNMSLYGYPKPTTPFLESLNVAAFNAIAPSNQTRLSIPLMLTAADVTNFEQFYSVPSVVTDLRRCGFETFWISNHGRTGSHDSTNSSIGQEAQHASWRDNDMFSKPDEVIVPQVREALERGSGAKAIFVQLMGSHFVYSGRYPKDFPTGPVTSTWEEYDESIRYTDKVLADLFALFTRENFLFVYASDHGQYVTHAWSEEEYAGHGFSPAFKSEYDVPFVVWSSKPARVEELTRTVGARRVNLESFDHIVRFLVGFSAEPNISFERKVLEVSESVIADYDALKEGTGRSVAAAPPHLSDQ